MHTKNIMSLTKITYKILSSFAILTVLLNLVLAVFSPVNAVAQTTTNQQNQILVQATDSKTVPPKSILCGGNTCPAIGAAGANQLAEKNGLAKFIIGIAQFLTFLAVALAVLFMVWGGFKYITSDGAEEAGRGKETLINAAIGLVIAIVAYTIVFLISSVVQGDFFGQFLG
jgi:Type IV secretion system pilin